jgi:hypothetical protein
LLFITWNLQDKQLSQICSWFFYYLKCLLSCGECLLPFNAYILSPALINCKFGKVGLSKQLFLLACEMSEWNTYTLFRVCTNKRSALKELNCLIDKHSYHLVSYGHKVIFHFFTNWKKSFNVYTINVDDFPPFPNSANKIRLKW